MFNTKSNTADLEGTLLQLDALHTSYAAILKSAESQLEALTLTDKDYKRMLEIANANVPYRSKITSEAAAAVLRSIKQDSDNSILDAIITKVSKVVLDGLNDSFKAGLPAIYQEVIDSDMFAKAVEAKLVQHEVMQESFTISEMTKALIQKINTVNDSQQGTAE